jgi:hypothetical protein
MIDKSRALQLLGTGLGPTEVSTTLGCDPSYISQLLMEDEFRTQVLSLRMQHLQQASARDQKIDSLEDDVLEKLQENIKYMTKTTDIMRAFAIINNAKRRGARSSAAINITQQIVQLTLPEAARVAFTTNATGEVVQIDDRPTITMPLQTLLKDRLRKQIGSSNGPAHETAGAPIEGASSKAAV